MEIIRIPASYFTQLEYLPDKDFNYVMKTVFKLCNWRNIKVEKSMRWGLVISIYREAIQMENKARSKKWKKRLEIDIATLTRDTMGDDGNPKGCDQVTSSNITEHQVKESKIKEKNIIVATKVATPKNLEFYIKDIIDIKYYVQEYNSKQNIIINQLKLFYFHWSEKKPNWKKELWQMQKTFDVCRRFHKWLENAQKWWQMEKVEKQVQDMNYDEKEQRLRDLWIL